MTSDISQSSRLEFIDVLKGLAILGVLLIHCGGDAVLPGIFGKVAANGHSGVQCFFLISAFLAFSSLRRYSVAMQSWRDSLKWSFSHLLRLVPLFYLAIVLELVFHGGSEFWLGEEKSVTFGNVLAHILFLHGFFPHYVDSILGVEWYLGVLAMFFFLAPLLYRILDNFEKTFALFLISTVAFIPFDNVIGTRLSSIPDSHVYLSFASHFNLFAQLPVLLMGIALFHISNTFNNFSRDNVSIIIKQPRLLSYSLLALGGLVLVGQILSRNNILFLTWDTICGITFFCVFLSQLIHKSLFFKIPPLALLGRYSYPIYLSHMMIKFVYSRFIPSLAGNACVDWIIRYCIVVVISLAISLLLDKCYDKPLRKLLHV